MVITEKMELPEEMEYQVLDDKGAFLKMFKRKFKDEFDFSESSFLSQYENESEDFDRFIYVVYDKFELLEFLKLDRKDSNVLLCLFNKQLYSLSFLEEVKNLILLDSSKTRKEIVRELKSYFNGTPDLTLQKADMSFDNLNFRHTKFQDAYKALFFLM
jgi:hypothetical protein